jgi:hypothetical protein
LPMAARLVLRALWGMGRPSGLKCRSAGSINATRRTSLGDLSMVRVGGLCHR